MSSDLDGLRAAVRRIEERRPAAGGGTALALGVAAIDSHLPRGGLAVGGLHEVAVVDAGAASAFSALLCARLAGDDGAVLWCENDRALDAGSLYAPGLPRFGLDPARLILVRTDRDVETLWAMEEGLRCAAVAAVVGAVRGVSPVRTRRLQLAAEDRAAALLLYPAAAAPGIAATRWRIAPAPGRAGGDGGSARPRWRLDLLRCRGGRPGNWDVEWSDETRDLALVSPLRDRPATPAPLRVAG